MSAPRGRLALMAAALVLAVGFLALTLSRPDSPLRKLKLLDFVQYWAAGRLLVAGENPYDFERLAALEEEAGRPPGDPIPMLNPPWALPLMVPLGYAPASAAHPAWLLLMLLVTVGCAEVLWRHFGGPPSLTSQLLTWTFVPSACALLYGQISPLLLLGATAFLVLVRRRSDFAAGAACCLLAVKPHLVYLFWPAVILWSVQHRRWGVLLGGAVGALVLVGVASAYRPTVMADYWHLMATKPPGQFESPTFGTLLRYALGDTWFGWQYVPLIPGLIWFALWWPRRWRREWDELLPPLLLVSMLTALYGAWLFDLVLLLVPLLRVAAGLAGAPAGRRWAAVAVHVAVNAVAFYLWQGMVSRFLFFIWITPVLLLAYVWLRPPSTRPQ